MSERRTYPDFLRDLALAAEELGYTMVSFDGRSATFYGEAGADLKVIIESVLLTPEMLPHLLVSRKKA